MLKTLMINQIPSLWDFACRLYSQSAVQTACLRLQDQYQMNISLLLFCCWSGRYYGDVSAKRLQQAVYFTDQWSAASTLTLRRLRQTMKAGFNPVWPLSHSEWDVLREQVKAVELESERLLLQGLQQLVIDCPPVQGSLQAVMHNIKSCFRACIDAESDMVRQIVQASLTD
jgi:uncharacterized protein (TIGR02444 family)